MRYQAVLDSHGNMNFLVLACLKLLQAEKLDLASVVAQLKLCLSSRLLSEEKEALLVAALMRVELSAGDLETHFLEPLRLDAKSLESALVCFLKELPETYEAKRFIERLELFLKHLNSGAVSDSLLEAEFLIKLSRYTDHEKTLLIHQYLIDHDLVAEMPGSLHEACEANNIPLLRRFIAQGAPVIALREGKTPLDISLEFGLSHARLVEVLITEYGAGIMQAIPDLLFALGIRSDAKPIFLGSQFDTQDARAHFPSAILALEDLMLQTGKDFSTLLVCVKRLEECMRLGAHAEEASHLRRRIRFMLPPVIKREGRYTHLPYFGLRHMIVERFPLSLFDGVPETFAELHETMADEDLDIRWSSFDIRREEQLALLEARRLKLEEFIAALVPYTVEGKGRFNGKIAVAVAVFFAAMFAVSAAFSFESLATLTSMDYHFTVDFILGASCTIMVLVMVLVGREGASSCLKRITDRPSRLSDLKKIHPDLMKFIRSLPEEAFLKEPAHEVERQRLDALRRMDLESVVEEVVGVLQPLKESYEAHIAELREKNLSNLIPFYYEELIDPEVRGQEEALLPGVSEVPDPGHSSGWEEGDEANRLRSVVVDVSNNNNSALFSRPKGVDSESPDEKTPLLRNKNT